MNPNMFSPEMMNQMKNMMNPQMMKQAADSFGNMSDDQIRAYLATTGMSHLSPQMFRQMSGNLKNMDDKELERLKNQNTNNFNRSYSTPSPNTTTTTPTTTNTSTSKTNNTTDDFEFSKPKTIIEKLEEIKNKGNDLFRSGKYKEACEKYYEALNELEYIADSEKITLKKQIEDMEIVCRLNIANSKLKMEDYDLVIHECLKVLKKTENFKAHYRAGVSFYKKGNYTKANHHFVKAKEINKSEEAVQIDKYLKECKEFIEENEKENNFKNKQNLNSNVNDTNSNNNNKNIVNNNSEVKSDVKIEEKKLTKIDKLKEAMQSDEQPKKENINSNKKNEDEIIIEEERNTNTSANYRNQNSQESNTIQTNTNIPMGMDTERLKKAEQELKNMDENQMDGMMGMIRGMDTATLKSMMAMQGMTLSDDQINMMKNMDPNMMKMMKNSGLGGMGMNMGGTTKNTNNSNINEGTNLSNNITGNGNNSTVTTTTPPNSTFPSMPDLKNMDMGGMMKMLQDNPQLMNMMGPQMSKMFGGGENGQGMNNEMMMKSMQNIMWLISLPSRIKSFFGSTKGKIYIGLIIILILAYYYR